MRFDIKEYKGDFCMHCNTIEEAQIFTKYLDSVGLRWCSGDSYLSENNFVQNGSNTHYYFNMGQYGTDAHAKENNYSILEFCDFIWNDEEEWVSVLKKQKEDAATLDAFLSTIKIY